MNFHVLTLAIISPITLSRLEFGMPEFITETHLKMIVWINVQYIIQNICMYNSLLLCVCSTLEVAVITSFYYISIYFNGIPTLKSPHLIDKYNDKIVVYIEHIRSFAIISFDKEIEKWLLKEK